MTKLIRYEKYSRKEIHDIFSPSTRFTPQTGTWGIQGIIKVPETKHDYIFLVTYGKKQSGYAFNEDIDENGILTWQSQPSQTLKDSRIKEFIEHDYLKDNIYLFLRETNKDKYTYMGQLAYVTHDKEREKPVFFKWQILDWEEEKFGNTNKEKIKRIDPKNFTLKLQEDNDSFQLEKREGQKTEDFLNNKKIDFEGEIKKNTELGNKSEEIVAEYEKKELIKIGREDLVKYVTLTREIAGNAERFDVLSFDKDGREKYIEVKATRGGANNLFHISEKEVQFSERYSQQYYFYRVYHFDEKSMTADLVILKGAIHREELEATHYTSRLKVETKNEK